MRRRLIMKLLSYQTLFAACHFCSDINQSALAAVLPFLIAAHHYDYTTAAMLVMTSNIIGSLIQPLLGTLSDKHSWPWIMPLGLLLAGGGMALTGVISNFYLLCLVTMVSGIGVAMFHPQCALLVNRVSTNSNRGISLSIFSFGGNMGFTFGPILIGSSILFFGLPGTLVFFIPEILIVSILLYLYPTLTEISAKPKQEKANIKERTTAPDQWSSFYKLSFVVIGRSIIFYGVNTFLVLYLVQHFTLSEGTSNLMLSLYYGIGAISTLLGGKLGDKYGYRRMAQIAFSLFFPAILLFSFTSQAYLAIPALLVMGSAICLSYSPLVVLGQQYLPNQVGLASGITLGLAVSIGGITAPLLGKSADLWGLSATFLLISALSLLPLAMTFFLSKPVARD